MGMGRCLGLVVVGGNRWGLWKRGGGMCKLNGRIGDGVLGGWMG